MEAAIFRSRTPSESTRTPPLPDTLPLAATILRKARALNLSYVAWAQKHLTYSNWFISRGAVVPIINTQSPARSPIVAYCPWLSELR